MLFFEDCSRPPHTSCQLHCLSDLSHQPLQCNRKLPRTPKKSRRRWLLEHLMCFEASITCRWEHCGKQELPLPCAPSPQAKRQISSDAHDSTDCLFSKVRPKILLNHCISRIKHQSQSLITFCNDNYITSQSQLLNLRWSSTLSNPFSSLPTNPSSSPCVTPNPMNTLPSIS